MPNNVLPMTGFFEEALNRALSYILRHDWNAPMDSKGRVALSHVMKKLRERHDQIRLSSTVLVLATSVLNHRFRFFGPEPDRLDLCSHISAAQGHTKPVELEEMMIRLDENMVPPVIMHLTNCLLYTSDAADE